MYFSLLLLFFCLGTIFGSFYNVVGFRLPNKESIIKPRSHCFKCGHQLKFYELIPIISFIIHKIMHPKLKSEKVDITLDGYTPEEGVEVLGVLKDIQNIKTDIQNIYRGTFTASKAISDQNGKTIDLTYAKIEDLKNGVVGVMKYLKSDGTIGGNIVDILTEVRNNLSTFTSFVQNHFTSGKANTASLSDRTTSDRHGNQIDTYYATVVALNNAIAEINKIKDGTVVAKKAEKDKDGNDIHSTYVKKANIVNNVTQTDTDKPLSAYQGKLLKAMIDDIYTLLQSDDTSLDQLQEIVGYIKNNRSLIEGITSSKVSVSDIIDNLVSSISDKPLSAKQGKVLKDLVDSKQAIISDLATIRAGAGLGATAVQPGDLAATQEDIDYAIKALTLASNKKLQSNLISNSFLVVIYPLGLTPLRFKRIRAVFSPVDCISSSRASLVSTSVLVIAEVLIKLFKYLAPSIPRLVTGPKLALVKKSSTDIIRERTLVIVLYSSTARILILIRSPV